MTNKIALVLLYTITFITPILSQPNPFGELTEEKIVLEEKQLDSLFFFHIDQYVGTTEIINGTDTTYIDGGNEQTIITICDKYLNLELTVYGTAFLRYYRMENYALSVATIKKCDFIYPNQPPKIFYETLQILHHEKTDKVINNTLSMKDEAGNDYLPIGEVGFCNQKFR